MRSFLDMASQREAERTPTRLETVANEAVELLGEALRVAAQVLLVARLTLVICELLTLANERLLAGSQFRFTILIIILLIIFASFTKGGRAMLGPVLLWITQQILMRMFALMKRVIWAHKVLILNLFTPRSVIFRSIAKKDDSKE